jgi:DnaJ-class molecular chaperone
VRAGCASCNGKKKIVEQVNLDLKIPAGVDNGAVLIGYGLGEQCHGVNEEPGDIVFHVKIRTHPDLMRQGPDLIWQTKISFEDSVNGKQIQVPHFDGEIPISTEEWGVLDPREDYVIPDKGFTKNGKFRVQFNVVYPKGKFILSRVI